MENSPFYKIGLLWVRLFCLCAILLLEAIKPLVWDRLDSEQRLEVEVATMGLWIQFHGGMPNAPEQQNQIYWLGVIVVVSWGYRIMKEVMRLLLLRRF